MDTQIHIVMVTIAYVVYNVLLNWMYIKEYIKDNKGVIRRGNEWEV
jgi:hypothetical protein